MVNIGNTADREVNVSHYTNHSNKAEIKQEGRIRLVMTMVLAPFRKLVDECIFYALKLMFCRCVIIPFYCLINHTNLFVCVICQAKTFFIHIRIKKH